MDDDEDEEGECRENRRHRVQALADEREPCGDDDDEEEREPAVRDTLLPAEKGRDVRPPAVVPPGVLRAGTFGQRVRVSLTVRVAPRDSSRAR